MATSDAPTREIGYAQTPIMSTSGASSGQWWMFEDETTPELRWPNSVFVYDQMRRQDSQVVSVLRAVTLPVRRTPWRIDPAGARDEVVQLVAEDLGLPIVGRDPEPMNRTGDRFSWPDHLREALLMLPFGHSYFEQVYRIVDGLARLRKLSVRMPKTIEEITVARDGGLISVTQYALGGGVSETPIPVNRLVAYIHEKEAGNWLGASLLRPAYKNWLLKDRLLRVQAQTIERNGMGIPTYTAAETEKDLTKGLGLATSLRAGEAAGAAVPFGAMLKLMGVEGQLPDAEPAIRYHDEQIGRAVLAHFLNLGTQTGSWALGSTFADFFTLSLQTLAQQIADVATQHIVEDLVDLNFGEEEPAPRVVFDEIGSRQAATAEAIRSLVDAGVITPDETLEGAVRQQFGLPPKNPDAEPEPAPEPDYLEASHDPAPNQVVAEPMQQTLFEDLDDDPIGVLDDETLVLLQAIYELEVESGLVHAAGFNPELHKKWPRGHPKAGKFRPMVDILKEAIRRHDGKGHPFANFTRPQLLGAAKARGIALKRGEDKDSIADKLLADLAIGKAKVVPPAPVKKVAKKAPAKKAAPAKAKLSEFKLDPADRLRVKVLPFAGGPILGKKESLKIEAGRKHIGAVHQEQDGTWTATPAGDGRLLFVAPPKNANRDQAIKALLDAHDAAAKQAPAIPGVEVNKIPQVFPVAPDAYEVKFNGVVVGHVHGDEADANIPWVPFVPGGAKWNLQNPGGKDTKEEAFKELVDSFNAAGNPKPQAPKPAAAPKDAGRFHRSTKGIEDLQKTVEGGQVVSDNRLAGGAVGDTRIRKYKDGTKLVWKKASTKHENDSEQLSALMARALGLNAPRIYRNEENAVNMEFKDGKVAYDSPLLNYMVDGVPDKVADTRDGRMMGLLDLLIANSDRHNGNWLIQADGRYVPIDHGYAFAGRPGTRLPDPSTAKRVRSGFAEHFYYEPYFKKGTLEWRPNDLTKSDVTEIRKRLQKLKPDFEHLGRANWHQFVMERLDEISKNATGTKSRLLPALV